MSVLIENMIIPSEGEYPITLYVCSDGTAYIDAWSLPQDCDKFPVVSVVRGKWILKHDYSTEEIEDGEKYWECSLYGCGSDSYDTTWHTPFCPNCGADMRGE